MINIVQKSWTPEGIRQFREEVKDQTGFYFTEFEENMRLIEGSTPERFEWKGYIINHDVGGYSVRTDDQTKEVEGISLKVTLENGKWLVNDKTTDNLSSLELRFLDMFFAEMKQLHHE